MDKKEYLNEEWYQKVKKKITKISLTIFIVSLVLGAGLISAGLLLTSNSNKQAEKTNEERYKQALKESQGNVDKANERIAELKKEIETLNTEISKLSLEISKMENEKSMIFRDDKGFSNRYYQKDNEIKLKQSEKAKLQTKLSEYKTEQFELENGDYTVYYKKEEPKDYTYLCLIGGIIAGAGLIIALIFYFIAKGREIKAYTIQQSMPVNQEAIEKVTPTVASSAGEIAKEVAGGIKEGIENQTTNVETEQTVEKTDNPNNSEE